MYGHFETFVATAADRCEPEEDATA
jgi:hypothetical protein